MLQTPRKFIYGFGLLFAAVLFTHSVCYGAKSVQLTSETHFRCPLLIHWLEDNPGKEESDAPLQYRSSRKTVGIGETVKLEVSGNYNIVTEHSRIYWAIVEGADRAYFLATKWNPRAEGKTSFYGRPSADLFFRLGDSIVDKRRVRVVATIIGKDVSKEIEFNVRIPDGKFLSRHQNPPEALYDIPKEEVGASTKLRVYPTPGEASFSGGVGLLEIDGGSPLDVLPSYGWRSLRKRSTFINFKHDPPKTFFRIGRYVESGMEDDVGFQRRRGWFFQEWFTPNRYFDYKNMSIDHSAYWLCEWYWRDVSKMSGVTPKYDGNPANRGTRMQSVDQKFQVLNDGNGTGILTKFQSQVKRVAKENETNEQEYGQIKNP